MNIDTIPLECNNDSLDTWAFIEIFGHDRTAGRVRTRNFGTQVMLQVDIPKSNKEFSHSRLLSPSAIFSIQPTTENWCRAFIASHEENDRPILPYIPKDQRLLDAERSRGTDSNNIDEDLPFNKFLSGQDPEPHDDDLYDELDETPESEEEIWQGTED